MFFHDLGDAGSRYVTPMSCDFADDLRSSEEKKLIRWKGRQCEGNPSGDRGSRGSRRVQYERKSRLLWCGKEVGEAWHATRRSKEDPCCT